MTSRITKRLKHFKNLEEVLPEADAASKKIQAYDRYYSQGGSQSDSADYFEVQRILQGGETEAVALPPKTPVRSDLAYIAETLCFYFDRTNQVRISIEALKGFILPQNFSPGELRELVTASSSDLDMRLGCLHILKSSGEKDFIYLDKLKKLLTSELGENVAEKVRDLIQELRGDDFPQIGVGKRKTLEEELIDRYRRGTLGPNGSTENGIIDASDLRMFLKTTLENDCDIVATEEDINEIIGIFSQV